MKNKCLENIPKNIRKYRLVNKMTQADVAAELDVDTQYYAQLERGERNFTVEKIIALCSILNVNIENIIEVPVVSEAATKETLQRVHSRLDGLSEAQLLLVERLIEDVAAFQK